MLMAELVLLQSYRKYRKINFKVTNQTNLYDFHEKNYNNQNFFEQMKYTYKSHSKYQTS